MEETSEYSCGTVRWFPSWMAGKAEEQFLDVLPGPPTCTSDRGLVSTPAGHWRSSLYTPSWQLRWTSHGTGSHVADRAETRDVSDCTWHVCSCTDLATASPSDQCSSYRSHTSQSSALLALANSFSRGSTAWQRVRALRPHSTTPTSTPTASRRCRCQCHGMLSLPHVLDVVVVVSCNDVTIVSTDARQAIVPALPVSDGDTSVVIARRRHDDDGPVERHEQLARRRRVQTDERVHRLPLGLTAVHRVELFHVVVANILMYTPTVNHLQRRIQLR